MEKLETLFLKDLSKILKKHNVCLCLESTDDYGRSEADLTFDIIDVSCSNYIKTTNREAEIHYEDIDKIIKD